MKITNTRKAVQAVLLLGATVLMQIPAQAQIGIGDVLGTAWTVKNAVAGETTLTPAYAVVSYTYRQIVTGLGSNGDMNVTRLMQRDFVGQYFYRSKAVDDAGNVTLSTNVFPINSLNQIGKTCVQVYGDKLGTNWVLETHTETVWMASAISTGLLPDNGPWTVWLKASGYKTTVCDAPPPATGWSFYTPADIGRSGHTNILLGLPNCILNYPFYLSKEYYR